MNEQFIKQTAQDMVDAGEYNTYEQAYAALTEGLEKTEQQEKQQRKEMVKHMNRRQRRKANRDADRLLHKLENHSIRPSQQFAALPEEKQKELLLKILERVHAQNAEYQEIKKNGTAETEAD